MKGNIYIWNKAQRDIKKKQLSWKIHWNPSRNDREIEGNYQEEEEYRRRIYSRKPVRSSTEDGRPL